ncbi:hypothetical protein [Paenibacillus sp. FSL K6-1230]
MEELILWMAVFALVVQLCQPILQNPEAAAVVLVIVLVVMRTE